MNAVTKLFPLVPLPIEKPVYSSTLGRTEQGWIAENLDDLRAWYLECGEAAPEEPMDSTARPRFGPPPHRNPRFRASGSGSTKKSS